MKTPLLSGFSVLLVDDNRDGLLVRRMLLEELGYRVEVAACADECLVHFAATAFDVVVTDYRMPRMNGVELIASLRKIKPNTNVILLSGFVEPLGLTEENTGADVVIPKSSTEPVQLARWIKRLVNRAPARKPPARQKNSTDKPRAASR